jgi:sugar-specific transcriptional regulator TrmB
MMAENQIINKLNDFGLNLYESKIWVALLSRGLSTAGELSDISNVPRSRSYDVLESLRQKGFIEIRNARPMKYAAVPPSIVLDRIKSGVQASMKEHITSIESIKNTSLFGELQSLNTQGVELTDPSDMNCVLRDRESAHAHIALLLKKAKISVRMSLTKEFLGESQDLLLPIFKEASANSISLQILLPKTDKESTSEIRKFADVRYTKNSISRFVVIDNKEVIMMLLGKAHPNYDVGVWVNTDFFASALSALFQSLWNQAQP